MKAKLFMIGFAPVLRVQHTLGTGCLSSYESSSSAMAQSINILQMVSERILRDLKPGYIMPCLALRTAFHTAHLLYRILERNYGISCLRC